MARNFGRPIVRIVLHCTASSQNASVDAILTYWKTPKGPKGSPYIPNVQGGLGWKNPGYHYLIGLNGERHILSHLSNITNGVRGYNWNSCHISYIGGKDGIDTRTTAQSKQMETLIKELRSDNILGPVPVVGHRDLSPDLNGDGIITPNEWIKLCPSFEVSDWLKTINIS